MNTIDLLTPIYGDIRNTNYFNGRLLTAEGLKKEQEANSKHHRQIGQALGEGLAFGLEVRLADTLSSGKYPCTVTVSAGMALNRLGEVLNLPEDTSVAIVPEKEKASEQAGFFEACVPSESAKILAGVGIYILTIYPVYDFDGYAPISGLGGEIRGPKGCGRSDTVEGVQFRVTPLSLETLGKLSPTFKSDLDDLIAKTKDAKQPDAAHLSKLRNLVAHICFGTQEITGFARDPFTREKGRSPYGMYGIPDTFRSEKVSILEDCEVPLGLIYLTSQGIRFVDMWSVRRRLVPRSTSATWPLFASERRLAEAEAVFLQFQDQIEEMKSSQDQSKLAGIKASDYFRYLPACGIIPIPNKSVKEYMKKGGSSVSVFLGQEKGYDPATFFDGITCRDPVFIEGAKLHSLLHESLYYPPVDLNSKEMLWLYVVRENVASITKQNQYQPYLIFTTGHMPYHGNARFDLARWDYSNYGIV